MLPFQKVLFVAERSQKDPKEYLPFLNELKKHAPPAYRRYKIDLHLRRYKDALKHLSEIHDEHREELLELIQAHRLYKEALQHFPLSSQVRVNFLFTVVRPIQLNASSSSDSEGGVWCVRGLSRGQEVLRGRGDDLREGGLSGRGRRRVGEVAELEDVPGGGAGRK